MKILILLMATFLQGCLGVGVFSTQVSTQAEQSVEQSKADILEKDHRYWSDGEYQAIQPIVEKHQQTEIVTYARPKEWCGAMLVVVPLMLPVCREEDVYYFEDEKLIKHTQKRVKYSGLLCSIFPSCPGGSDCTLCTVE